MPYTVVFLWISGGAALGAPQLAELDDFGAARGLTLRAPARGASQSAGLAAYDGALADRLEGELEQARTALSALEERAAMQRLTHIEADLLAHPHLPQAGFLMAECLALQALAARPRDPTRADELEQSRFALEGPRATAFGEDTAGRTTPPPGATKQLRVTGLSSIDRVELDGSFLALALADVSPGLHHARVWRAGRPIFATFLRVRAADEELHLPVPALAPCSADDLGSVTASHLAPGAALPRGIACERWAVVRDEGPGIAVALCSRSSCGPLVHWQHRPLVPFRPLAVDRRHVPAWASFAIAGAAVAAATSVVLWQAGAFDTGNPSTPSFRYDGVNPQGIRF